MVIEHMLTVDRDPRVGKALGVIFSKLFHKNLIPLIIYLWSFKILKYLPFNIRNDHYALQEESFFQDYLSKEDRLNVSLKSGLEDLYKRCSKTKAMRVE